jgi:hypothetical protein
MRQILPTIDSINVRKLGEKKETHINNNTSIYIIVYLKNTKLINKGNTKLSKQIFKEIYKYHDIEH